MVDQSDENGNKNEEESILGATVSDQPAYDDSLGFNPYVEAITEFLINPSTEPPLTLSIEGPWGSGKSSFMLQIEKRLKEKGEYTVLFNAWRHDKEDTMWAAFALEFIRQLSRDLTLLQQLKAEYKLLTSRIRWRNKRKEILQIIAIFIFLVLYLVFFYLKGFEWINSLQIQFIILSYLGASYAFYKVISSFIVDLEKLFGNSIHENLKKCIKIPDYENRTTFIEEFHEDFKNIVECYAGRKKVFVFIDDLDRCEVPKAADLMQSINLMISNDPHIIFIIGMDRLKVASGLAVKYEKLLPYMQESRKNYEDLDVQKNNSYKGLEYGYEFLEKFIQLPFLVPQPEDDDLELFLYKNTKTEKEDIVKLNFLNSFNNLNKKVKNYCDKVRSNSLGKIKKIDSKLKNDQNNENIIKMNSSNQRKKESNDIKEQKEESNDNKKRLVEEEKKLFERIKISVSSDSPKVHEIVRMVLPTLDFNPRRVKQFINLFRLKAFIASKTGLFCTLEGTSSEKDLSLEKLGKFVAITLKWPLIISDLNFNNNLLNELQEISLTKSNDINKFSNEAKRWSDQERLIDLLRYGYLSKEDSRNPEFEKIFSLSNLNIGKLLQTSQPLDRTSIITSYDMKIRILERMLKTNFQGFPDEKQALLDLHRLIYDQDSDIKWRAAKVIGNVYRHLSEKEKALMDLQMDLQILASDKDELVRVYANHSLGKISIFQAAQAEKEEDYKKELEKAIAFFEKAAKESLGKSLNPSQFCLPFYRSFYTIIFKKQEAKEEVDNYLEEVKAAIEGSESKKHLFEAVENLAEALKEAQNMGNLDLQAMKGELSLYRKYCDHAAELIMIPIKRHRLRQKS